MTSSTNTATNTATNTTNTTNTVNNKDFIYSDEIDWFLLLEFADEKQHIRWDIEVYEKLYREFYENIDYADLFHDPLELLDFIVMHKRESRFTTEIIDEKAELERENENLKYKNEQLRNSNTSNDEMRMLRQTIRRRTQTIASLQLQLNQARINRDSFNPMEDTQE